MHSNHSKPLVKQLLSHGLTPFHLGQNKSESHHPGMLGPTKPTSLSPYPPHGSLLPPPFPLLHVLQVHWPSWCSLHKHTPTCYFLCLEYSHTTYASTWFPILVRSDLCSLNCHLLSEVFTDLDIYNCSLPHVPGITHHPLLLQSIQSHYNMTYFTYYFV